MDSNKDGKVDIKEFIKACKKHNYIILQYLKDFVTLHSKNAKNINQKYRVTLLTEMFL